MLIDFAVGNVQLMQKINRLKVLNFIRRSGEAARPEIARYTGLSPSSITNIVSYLLERKLVVEVGRVDSKEVGRKAALIRFNPAASNIISVNIEVSKISVALTDLDGNIIRKNEIPLERLSRDYEILNTMKREINAMVQEAQTLPVPDVVGIGIAVSGLVLDDEKLIISTSLRWRGLSLKDYFENAFKVPVYVQNNSRTKALSELRKAGKKIKKNIVFLDLTMGVGMINFYDNEFNRAVIGEIGHTTVKKDGPVCFCGNHGCLEVMCSVETIINQCGELLQNGRCRVLKELLENQGAPLTYDAVLDAFGKGDEDVREVLAECAEYLGIGIANIINTFNPQKIIINGDVLLSSDFIYEKAVAAANSRAYEQFTKDLKYEKVDIGDEQALAGVSLYVTDRLFELTGPDF